MEEYNGLAIVTFIDALGFSSDIETNWQNSENNSLSKFKRIRNSLPSNKAEYHSKFEIVDIGTNKPVFTSNIIIRNVSDSIILISPIKDIYDFDAFLSQYGSNIFNMQFAWKSFIEEGFTIRGGIELGQIYYDSDDVIGPALIDAYQLESKQAITSRVMVGKKLANHLFEMSVRFGNPLPFQQILNTWQISQADGFLQITPSVLSDDPILLEKLISIQNKCIDNEGQFIKYQNIIEFLSKKHEPVKPDISSLQDLLTNVYKYLKYSW